MCTEKSNGGPFVTFREECEILRARVVELEAQLADISVKRDVAVDTLEKVKADRKVAQQALAEQCKETKSLRDQLAERDAEIALLKTTPPDMRQDLHCVASDLARECREERERADANEAIVEHLQKLLLLAKNALEEVYPLYNGHAFKSAATEAIAAINDSKAVEGLILCDRDLNYQVGDVIAYAPRTTED